MAWYGKGEARVRGYSLYKELEAQSMAQLAQLRDMTAELESLRRTVDQKNRTILELSRELHHAIGLLQSRLEASAASLQQMQPYSATMPAPAEPEPVAHPTVPPASTVRMAEPKENPDKTYYGGSGIVLPGWPNV